MSCSTWLLLQCILYAVLLLDFSQQLPLTPETEESDTRTAAPLASSEDSAEDHKPVFSGGLSTSRPPPPVPTYKIVKNVTTTKVTRRIITTEETSRLLGGQTRTFVNGTVSTFSMSPRIHRQNYSTTSGIVFDEGDGDGGSSVFTNYTTRRQIIRTASGGDDTSGLLRQDSTRVVFPDDPDLESGRATRFRNMTTTVVTTGSEGGGVQRGGGTLHMSSSGLPGSLSTSSGTRTIVTTVNRTLGTSGQAFGFGSGSTGLLSGGIGLPSFNLSGGISLAGGSTVVTTRHTTTQQGQSGSGLTGGQTLGGGRVVTTRHYTTTSGQQGQWTGSEDQAIGGQRVVAMEEQSHGQQGHGSGFGVGQRVGGSTVITTQHHTISQHGQGSASNGGQTFSNGRVITTQQQNHGRWSETSTSPPALGGGTFLTTREQIQSYGSGPGQKLAESDGTFVTTQEETETSGLGSGSRLLGGTVVTTDHQTTGGRSRGSSSITGQTVTGGKVVTTQHVTTHSQHGRWSDSTTRPNFGVGTITTTQEQSYGQGSSSSANHPPGVKQSSSVMDEETIVSGGSGGGGSVDQSIQVQIGQKGTPTVTATTPTKQFTTTQVPGVKVSTEATTMRPSTTVIPVRTTPAPWHPPIKTPSPITTPWVWPTFSYTTPKLYDTTYNTEPPTTLALTFPTLMTTVSHVRTTTAPTTQAPTTPAPTTQAPTTQAPTTQVPTTQAPTTLAPTTLAPTTQAPTTQAPTTQAPTTQAPTTQAATTQAATTLAPTTLVRTTPRPTTQAPTTPAPTTQAPTTQAPTTPAPTTQAPTTLAPTTQAPTTQAPTTQAPTTPAPTTPAPTTPAATTPTPTTPHPTTSAPSTTTPAPATTTPVPTTTTFAPTSTQAPTTTWRWIPTSPVTHASSYRTTTTTTAKPESPTTAENFYSYESESSEEERENPETTEQEVEFITTISTTIKPETTTRFNFREREETTGRGGYGALPERMEAELCTTSHGGHQFQDTFMTVTGVTTLLSLFGIGGFLYYLFRNGTFSWSALSPTNLPLTSLPPFPGKGVVAQMSNALDANLPSNSRQSKLTNNKLFQTFSNLRWPGTATTPASVVDKLLEETTLTQTPPDLAETISSKLTEALKSSTPSTSRMSAVGSNDAAATPPRSISGESIEEAENKVQTAAVTESITEYSRQPSIQNSIGTDESINEPSPSETRAGKLTSGKTKDDSETFVTETVTKMSRQSSQNENSSALVPAATVNSTLLTKQVPRTDASETCVTTTVTETVTRKSNQNPNSISDEQAITTVVDPIKPKLQKQNASESVVTKTVTESSRQSSQDSSSKNEAPITFLPTPRPTSSSNASSVKGQNSGETVVTRTEYSRQSSGGGGGGFGFENQDSISKSQEPFSKKSAIYSQVKESSATSSGDTTYQLSSSGLGEEEVEVVTITTKKVYKTKKSKTDELLPPDIQVMEEVDDYFKFIDEV